MTNRSYWESIDSMVNAIERDPSAASLEQIEAAALALISWRVGPVQLGPLAIDTEWRSSEKLARILPLLGDLRGKSILDIGCSNGFFSFELAKLGAAKVLGIDPNDRCAYQWRLTQAFNNVKNVRFKQCGILELPATQEKFDIVLCMGVIFHQRDPLAALQTLKNFVNPDGIALIESVGVPGVGEEALVPTGRYAKMRNAWWIPTERALTALTAQTGFKKIAVHYNAAISIEEQRRTKFAPYESLKEFLHPNDLTKTVEGYPAPHSIIVTARVS